jgi:hypothetical protein
MEILPFVRSLLFIDPLRLSKDDAARVAESALGRPLPEPFDVRERLNVYVISTKLNASPGGPWFIIDGHSGHVLRYGQPVHHDARTK